MQDYLYQKEGSIRLMALIPTTVCRLLRKKKHCFLKFSYSSKGADSQQQTIGMQMYKINV